MFHGRYVLDISRCLVSWHQTLTLHCLCLTRSRVAMGEKNDEPAVSTSSLPYLRRALPCAVVGGCTPAPCAPCACHNSGEPCRILVEGCCALLLGGPLPPFPAISWSNPVFPWSNPAFSASKPALSWSNPLILSLSPFPIYLSPYSFLLSPFSFSPFPFPLYSLSLLHPFSFYFPFPFLLSLSPFPFSFPFRLFLSPCLLHLTIPYLLFPLLLSPLSFLLSTFRIPLSPISFSPLHLLNPLLSPFPFLFPYPYMQ